MNENMEFPDVDGNTLEELQEEFVSVLKCRAQKGNADDGKVR